MVMLTLIAGLSLWPSDSLPQVPGTDKTHHLIAYAMLMLPTALRRPPNWIIWGLLFILYSGALELIQPYVNRHGEWMDLFVNFIGVLCGAIIAVLFDSILIPKQAKQSANTLNSPMKAEDE